MEPLGNMPRFPIIFCRTSCLLRQGTQRSCGRLRLPEPVLLVVAIGGLGEGWPLEYVQPAVYRSRWMARPRRADEGRVMRP